MERELAQIINEMIVFDSGDLKRINHFMKVYAYASAIAALEDVPERTRQIIEVTAVLHDIGIKVCEKKYGRCGGDLQEKEGPPLARNLLNRLGMYDIDFVDRVCYLIGRHHTYSAISGIDFQILVEADLLVNMEEDQVNLSEVRHIEKSLFQTEAGIAFLQNMFYEQ